MRSARLRAGALLIGAMMVVAACGTRLNEDERAMFARGQVSGQGGSSSDGVSADGGTDGIASADGGSAGGDIAIDGGTSGGTTGTGGTTGGGQPVAGDAPCSAPSSEVGVTDSTLTLGGVFQLSGLLPGFAKTALSGAQAYVDYLNSNDGLCGRKVQYVVADDGFDASRNADETRGVTQKALALVGGFSAADDGAAGFLSGSNVLDVGVGTTAARQAVPNHYPMLAPERRPNDPGVALPEWKYVAEKGAKKLAIVLVAAAAGRSTAQGNIKDAKAAGLEIVLTQEVSPTQFSFASTARAVAESGADVVLCLLEINGSVQLAEELARIPNSLKYPFYRLGYDQKFLNVAGPAAEGAVSFLEFLPFEERGSNQALDTFLEHFDKISPDQPPTFQAIQGWVAMDAFTQLIRTLPGPITRDALVEAAKGFHTWKGNGLFKDIDFASKKREACKVVVRVVNGKYQREAPASGFYC